MEKDLINRFNCGNTSFKEEKRIRHWMETSEVNRRAFMQERKTSYTILFNVPNLSTAKQGKRYLSRNQIGTTAAELSLLIVRTPYIRTLISESFIKSEYNRLVVPAGQRIHFILADNTDNWLNTNSTFSYTSGLSKNGRTVFWMVFFFDVSKDNKKPFVVNTISGDI